MKRILSILLALAMLLSMCALAACSQDEAKEPKNGAADAPADNEAAQPEDEAGTDETQFQMTQPINLGLLKGPTGIGAVYLMDDTQSYNITMGTAPDELTSGLINGSLDIAAVPTNVAANLYNKTEGGVTLLALNTLGVLYILENGDSVQSMADLAGRTLYATGQGSNPEYVLNYLLRANGLEPGVDVNIEFLASDELATRMAAGEIDLCMLPVPNATSVLVKNPDVRTALSLTDEWNKTENGSVLTMGCVVARTEFAENNPEAVAAFLEQYAKSVTMVQAGGDEVCTLIAAQGLVGSEAIAKAALPQCNITFISGEDIYDAINGYYTVLYDADPTSIGGSIPDEGFYYVS